MASYYLVLNSAFVTWVFQHTQAQANQVFEKSAIVTINVPLFAGDGDDNIWTFANDGDDNIWTFAGDGDDNIICRCW